MNAQDLQNIEAGFEHEAFGSQAVFRAALNALSHPGTPFSVPLNTALPRAGGAASAALLLGLLDSDTSVWVSPTLASSDAANWLRFHTGCQVVKNPSIAHFLWVEQGDVMPPLSSLKLGSDEYPDESATCVVEVQSFDALDQGLHLQGPGIQETSFLGVTGLPHHFDLQWAKNHALFPRGVDVLFTTQTTVVGLPRTTGALPYEKE
jgi:alpha-D-ribose 1-methylphosphonate 5-triphosphate synthase subunit PhnH